jgi:hypothetical protein
MNLLKTFFLALLTTVAVHATPAPQATATLTPDSSYLLPAGGTVTFTAAVAGYPGTTSAIGWTVTLPTGWAYVSGAGEPSVTPLPGDTGTLGWAYTTIPANASFSFTVSYPANLTANATIASAVIVRFSGNRQDVTPTAVTLQPATIPIVTNTGTTSATFNSTLSLDITATSPIAITGYGATGLPTGLTLDGTTGHLSGAPTQVGTFTVHLTATNAAGTSEPATISLQVANANASVTLGALAATYNGQPHAATATTDPANLAVSLLYGTPGSATAPTDAGTYPVSATVTTTGYTATASGSLVIAPAAQTIAFAAVGTVQPGSHYTLSATATSALPVTFAVVSGSASISGATLTVNGTGAIVVRATQAGSNNYLAATADQTLAAAKLNQTITFATPADKLATDDPFTLTATASSNLPVTFTLVSGPAFLSGSTITLTGAAGTVFIRASQAGNATYNAAADVARSFEVTADDDRVFFGDFFSAGAGAKTPLGQKKAASAQPVGDIAAVLPAQSNTGTLLIVAPTVGVSAVIPFTLQLDGSFVSTTTQVIAGVSREITVRGQLAANVLSGSIDGLGFSFTTDVEPRTGPSADAAGFYQSTGLSTATATTYTIIGSNNNVLVLAITPTLTIGGPATLQSDGTFQLDLPATGSTPAVTLKGTVDAPTTTVSGAILVAQQPPVDLAGLKNTTSRTDRLINLSSRAKVGPGEKLLITGLVVGGTTPKPVLVRAVGPGLTHLGVNGVLQNPKIRIEKAGTIVAENDDWGTNADPAALVATTARIGAFPLSANSTDAALLTTLAPGVYTVQVTASGATTQDGVAMAEIYDASENPSADYQRLVNISSRGEVTSGENILIGGFIVTGNSPKKILVRGIGPGLAAQQVGHPLADPLLKVYQGGTVLATNDNWSADATAAAELTAATTALGAFPLAAGSKDAALILNLAPGYYTAHVLSADGSSGIALVEIYEIPE